MTEQRYDITVRDQVARSIRSELKGIGTDAKAAAAELRQLKADLAGINASTTATRDAAKATSDATRADADRARQARDTAKALEAEAAAQARISAMVDASLAKQKQQATSSFIGGASAGSKAAMAAQTGVMAASFGAVAKDAKAAESALGAVKGAGEGAFAAIKTGAAAASSGTAKLAEKAFLSSTAIRELLVLAREGGRGDFTRMAGSASILAQALGILGIALPAAAGGFAALFLAHKAFNDETAKGQLKEYASTLGLTTKEMRKLSDTTLDHKGHLEEINLVQVTYGDTLKGIWGATKDLTVQLLKGTVAASLWGEVSSHAGNLWQAAMGMTAKAVLYTLAVIKEAAASAYHLLAAGYDVLTGNMSGAKENAKAAVDDLLHFGDKVNANYAAMKKGARDYYADARKQAVDAARARLAEEAKAIINNRNPKVDHTAERQAEAVAKVLRQLRGELDNLGDVGTEGRIKQKMTEITNSLATHKVDLNAKAWAGLRAQILSTVTAIERERPVAQQQQRIYDETTGVLETYQATREAINKEMVKGTISLDEATRRQNLATNTYDQAIKPMLKYNEALRDRTLQLTLYGKELAVQQRAVEIFNREVDAGNTTREKSKPGDFVGQARREIKQQDQTSTFAAIDPKENDRPGSSSYVLDHAKELYASLNELRQKDVISEQDAAERKKNLDRAVLDAKLEYTGSILGQVASLQTSKNKELAALGKAAAIAQATIDGYRAVQAALVGPPGPPWSYAIAATTAAMTAVNVAKIAGVGFMSGGYTGSGANDSVKGQVHANEFVFDAQATRRLGIPALEAMRSGAILNGRPSNDNGPRITLHQHPGTVIETQERSDGEIEIIATRVAKRVAPQAVADDIHKSPNSRTSTALRTNFNVSRRR